MGWWSATVMGGDEPLDNEGEILFGICEIDPDDLYDDRVSVADVRDALYERLDVLASKSEGLDEIFNQVLGVLVMKYGLPKEDTRVVTILENAVRGAKCDDWASYNDERKSYMDQFIKTIREYDGTPTEVPEEGLLDKLAEAIVEIDDFERKKGLINKNV